MAYLLKFLNLWKPIKQSPKWAYNFNNEYVLSRLFGGWGQVRIKIKKKIKYYVHLLISLCHCRKQNFKLFLTSVRIFKIQVRPS